MSLHDQGDHSECEGWSELVAEHDGWYEQLYYVCDEDPQADVYVVDLGYGYVGEVAEAFIALAKGMSPLQVTLNWPEAEQEAMDLWNAFQSARKART